MSYYVLTDRQAERTQAEVVVVGPFESAYDAGTHRASYYNEVDVHGMPRWAVTRMIDPETGC